MSEWTWGMPIENIKENEGWEDPPVGHYAMEIIDVQQPALNSKGDKYMRVIYSILDAQDSEWIKKKYSPYVSMKEKPFGITKANWRKMGVPLDCLKNDGNMYNAIGTVFECDLVKSTVGDREFLNFRNIVPMTSMADAQPAEKAPEEVEAPVQPAPKRATPSGRR